MLDRSLIGVEVDRHQVLVEAGRLRFFATAIGERNPVYSDLEAAKAAGYPDLPVPPTFLFCLENEIPDPFAWARRVGINLARILHGEQHFTYHRMSFAGDCLTYATVIKDIYDKKGGALEFVVRETRVMRGEEPVADLTSIIVHRSV